MRTLVIETATEACSVALFEGPAFEGPSCKGSEGSSLKLLDHRHEILGRGHAERLVPMIAELPDRGRADFIRVSLGPGSFTGLRIGIAAARALGIAWRAEVLGYPTLALIAAHIKQHSEKRAVTVCMNGGHSEWFVQNFSEDLLPEDEMRSLSPDQAVKEAKHSAIIGNRAQELANILGEINILGENYLAIDMLPDARQFSLLGPEHFTAALAPLYGRAPDAKLPGAKLPGAKLPNAKLLGQR